MFEKINIKLKIFKNIFFDVIQHDVDVKFFVDIKIDEQ